MKKLTRSAMAILALCMTFLVGCMGFMPQMPSSSSSSSSASSSQLVESSIESSSEESSIESSLESSSEESSVESSSSAHEHVFEGEWKSTSSYHWLVCACGERSEVASHKGQATSCAEKPRCEICGREFGKPADHTYGELTDVDGVKGYPCDGCDKMLSLESREENGEFVEGIVDFVVEVDEGKDPVVLQLSDTQIMDKQAKSSCYQYVTETVEATDPDLILITGDVVYGKFDTDGTILLDFIAFMDSLEIPWAPVFGNHDNECPLGVDWQCEQLENAQYCLFEQRNLTGNGNYTVGIMQGGALLRVFYMMDSNGCGNASEASMSGVNGIKKDEGFGNSQISWYKQSMAILKTVEPDVKISFAFHIQLIAFGEAFEKYNQYDGLIAEGSNSALKNPVNIDELRGPLTEDFGYIGRVMKGPWDIGNVVFSYLKEAGVDSFFVGHEHCNSASILLDGVRFQYGQKSSTYDRYNVLTASGAITDNSSGSGTELIGGTVIPLSQEDGSIVSPYIYLCGDPLGNNP